ncbi:MAG TPA: hypothetical protein VMH80_22690 [Bryobacteraceae bacterium]|nr:hypothetical protein [Bryobacteraceae bacterium]
MPTKTPAKRQSIVALVTSILEGYASKAVFRGFNAQAAGPGKARYRMVWHYERQFELTLDVRAKTLRFADLLPGMPAKSAIYKKLKAFLKERQSPATPEHRRVNPAKARLRVSNRAGNVSLAFSVPGGDFEYATRKIIHLVHEIFLVFLIDGNYYEYLVEQLGLDPDRF